LLAVFIIDCGEHTILEQMAGEGRLPALGRLIGEGASVPLTSEAHILDGSVFQTLLTGVNPGQHGIYKYRQLVPGTYRYEMSRAENSPVPQIWSSLSRLGLTSAVMDVPKAFPVEGFRGTLLASWGAYSPAGDPASIPGDLLPRVLDRFGQHPRRSHLPLPIPPERYLKVLEELEDAVRTRSAIFREVMAMGPHDFLITAFSETHVAGHQFWHLRDPGHPMFDAGAADLCGDAMERIYQACDAEVARMVGALPPDSQIVLMTQQGLQNNYSGSHLIPAWLARRAGRPGSVADGWRAGTASLLGSGLRHRLAQALPSSWADRWVSGKYRPDGEVFMLPGSEFMTFLRVNLRGREPKGTVPPDAYRSVLEGLRGELLDLVNPGTGRPAAAEVIHPPDDFPGECQADLPDLVIRWKNDAPVRGLECPVHGRIERGLSFIQNTHSCHTGEGLAVVAGPGISRGNVGETHSLQDLTATLYGLLGAAPPEHLEGSPIPL